MNYYTSQIPQPLVEKLKEKGIHQLKDNRMEGWLNSGNNITYAEVFDWLIERGWFVNIGREYDFATEQVTERFEWAIEKVECFSNQPDNASGWCDTWYEAANAAIEKALELI